MIENKAATRQQFDDIWADWRAAIDRAIAFAEESPLPSPDQVLVDVYTTGGAR
jgi:TPP-dependent pyruvate/acetoin dehydrogenase alpha subunit